MAYRTFLSRFLPRKKAAHSSSQKSRRQRKILQLEALEDRLAPAVLIPVTTHRDLVFDPSRQLLYITTSKGTVERYDVVHQTLLTPWAVGTSLNGADITPDGSALFVGENSQAGPGALYKVNLADGTVQNATWTGNRTVGEYGCWEVAISSNGTGMVTTRFNGGGSVYLHQLNLATNTVTSRTDEPTAVGGTIDQDTQVHRGADRSLLLLTEPDSSGPYFTYDAPSNTFPNSGHSNDYQSRMLSAVSRDGALIATAPTDDSSGGVTIRDGHLNLVTTLLADDFSGMGLNGGVAFDPTQNILYVVNSFHSQIYAYDTTTWNRIFRLNIGEAVSSEQALGNGVMTVSPDSHWLFLATTAGVRMFDLTAPPQLSVNDVTINDGNGVEATNAQFTVTLSRIEKQPVTVNYATADGTATAVQDYVATSGTLFFSPTVSTLPDPGALPLAMTQTFNVPVINGGGNENEAFAVNLGNASNAQIGKGQGIGTIQNTPVYTPNASINSVSVVENSPNTVFAVFTVAFRGAVPGQSYTINYATSDVTAKAGVDYTATSGTLTFTVPSDQTISVPVTGGVQHAQDLRFYVNISSPSFFIQLSQGTATIVANTLTAVPSIMVNDVTVHKGTGLSYAVFTVSLSSSSGSSIGVDCATADQSDLPSSVYTPVAQALVFPPGTTSQTVTVTIRGNDFVEPTKTFLLNLKNATNALITRAEGTGTILSDINALLSIDNVRVAEGSSGTVNALFTVTLSGITSQPVTVNYATADGTATAGTDYQAASGTLTFEPGQTASETVSVPINSDSTPEGDKTFFVNLSGATNSTLVNTSGTATILSDIPPSLQAPNVTLQKPTSGTQNAVFTVTLPNSSHRTVTVAYTTVDGTAKAGIDYQATSGTLTFAPGQTSLTVSVPVFGNTQSNPDRTFTLQLTNTTAPGGIAMVNDPFPIGSNIGPAAPVLFNNALYFSANDGVSGNELWKYDGTSFTMVADINPGPKNSDAGEFGWGIYNGALYFSADAGVDGHQLWKYDGTKVSQVSDVFNFGNGSWPGDFMVFNGKLYYTAADYPDGFQVWSTDGATATMVTKLSTQTRPTLLGVVGNQLLFNATTSTTGSALWKYDGANVSMVSGTQNSNPIGHAIYNGALYLSASDSFYFQELFKYDGTAMTFVAAVNKLTYYGAVAAPTTVFNGLLYFSGADESHGSELWQYDGTAVSMIQDTMPGPVGLGAGNMVPYDGELYFNGNDRMTGSELWKYDGTSITQAADINPGFFSSYAYPDLVWNGSLYLLANDGVHGGKLWTYTEPFVAANSQATCTIQTPVNTPVIVDNGTPGYSDTGTWATGVGQPHYGPDFRYSAAGAGANTAIWQVSGLASAKYDVQMTWSAWPNQATNAPFKIYDGSTLLAMVTINQKVDPLGVTVSGSVFQSLGTFSITSGTVKVVLSNNANGYIIADAMRVATPPNTTVDLNWTGGSLTGPSATDTQSTFTISRTYNVSGGPVPADFTIGYFASLDTNIADGVLLGRENITSSADKSNGLHAGTSQPFQISNGGNYYLFARLDDANVITETDKTNNIAQTTQQTVVALVTPYILDNGQFGYSETGTWVTATGQGHYGPDLRYSAPGGGENTATWQVGGLASGKYDVQMTWSAWPNQATNAPFKIYDGSTLLATVTVNQKADPAGTQVGTSVFQSLGNFTIASGTLKVLLSNNANGYVIADAMRVATPAATTLDLNWIGGGITGPAATDTQSTFTISRTYNVSGGPVPADFTIGYYASLDTIISDGILLGRETIAASADKSNGTHSATSPAFQLSNGGKYYLFARLDDTNVISETDKTNNVAQTAQQTAVAAVTPYILDNGQYGYSETGTWVTATGQGHYGPDLRYSPAGGGENTATWQVGGLASGTFNVQVTWSAWPNQATNAPYQIYDGTTLLATVLINQKVDPVGTTVGTSVFQSLGTFTITSGTLKVILSNNANGYVIADALRVV